MHCVRNRLLFCFVAASVLAAPAALAQDADKLAKELANPISSLVSLPFQLNWDTHIGPDGNGDKYYMNIQPVIPVSISENWNMISRTIIPVVDQSDIFPGAGSQFGLGDVTQSLFFSPKAPTSGGWIWGAGPVFLIPTATNDLLGNGKWGAGPTFVVLKQTASQMTFGALVNQIWSFAGDGNRPNVNALYFQPFIAQGLGKGRTITFDLESTYNWNGDTWTIPVNIMYSSIHRWGHQMVSLQYGVRYYLDAPPNAAQWGLRFNLTLLFPKK